MYLQSAEIRNFRGIRHLKVDFEKDTSVLIGENAWGKSSLLYALFMILGRGTDELCEFAEDDLYVPIKLESDHSAEQNSCTANSDIEEINDADSAKGKIDSDSNSLLNLPANAKLLNIVSHKDFKRLYYKIPAFTPAGSLLQTVDLPNPLYEALRAKHDNEFKALLNSFCDLDERASSNERAPILSSLQQGIEDEACYDASSSNFRSLSASEQLRNAQDFLAASESLNHEARRTAQEDVNFLASDIYQENTDSIVIDLIFCETSHGVLNRIDRFEPLRAVAYESDDGRSCIHYRITASSSLSNNADEQDTESLSALVSDNKTLPEDPEFVTKHELLDSKSRPIECSKQCISELITLNPLLRLRDRRMFRANSSDEDGLDKLSNDYDTASPDDKSTASLLHDSEEFAAHSDRENDVVSQDDMRSISQLFSYITEDDSLNSVHMNDAISVLNTIASKYLTNYQSSTHIYNKALHNHPRTAREIVSHPVSVASLSSLKQAISDSKPSNTKFLLSILAGALLMSRGERRFDEYARPILILEDIESRFHPTLLLNLWSILQVLPVQKIITTNSSQLLSAISLHNVRRLCKQYYDVRCYKVRDKAFSADDERKISFHVRMSRPSALFARCWILVEGETEVWMLNEIASVLGINLGCNGIRLIEFAQCGLTPLIKLARQLGIAFHVLTDGDTAGQHYAASVREFTGGRHLAEHLSVMPHVDIEHYLYASGFADVYQKAAGLTIKQVSDRQIQSMMDKIGVSEIIAMANEGESFEQIADTAATNLENSDTDVHHKNQVSNASAASISCTVNPNRHKNKKHNTQHQPHHQGAKPRPAPNHNLESIIVSISGVNFGEHTQHLKNVLHRGKKHDDNGKSVERFDIKELTSNDVHTLYKYLRGLVDSMPRPSHNFTPKQSRMLKSVKAICGILSGIANNNKQRFASRLKKYERNASKNHYKSNNTYQLSAKSNAHQNINAVIENAPSESIAQKLTEQLNDDLAFAVKDKEEVFTACELDSNHGIELSKPNVVMTQVDPNKSSDKTTSSLIESKFQDSADSVSSTNELSPDADIGAILSKSCAHDNKEALLKLKAMADEAMMKEQDRNRVKHFERSSGKAANAIHGALNDQELQRQGLNMNKVIEHAIRKKTKPGMAILVGEAMQKRGKDSVPLMFKTMFRKINRMASNELSFK